MRSTYYWSCLYYGYKGWCCAGVGKAELCAGAVMDRITPMVKLYGLGWAGYGLAWVGWLPHAACDVGRPLHPPGTQPRQVITFGRWGSAPLGSEYCLLELLFQLAALDFVCRGRRYNRNISLNIFEHIKALCHQRHAHRGILYLNLLQSYPQNIYKPCVSSVVPARAIVYLKNVTCYILQRIRALC